MVTVITVVFAAICAFPHIGFPSFNSNEPSNGGVDRARRFHSTFDSINQVTKHATRAPVQRFVMPHSRGRTLYDAKTPAAGTTAAAVRTNETIATRSTWLARKAVARPERCEP